MALRYGLSGTAWKGWAGVPIMGRPLTHGAVGRRCHGLEPVAPPRNQPARAPEQVRGDRQAHPSPAGPPRPSHAFRTRAVPFAISSREEVCPCSTPTRDARAAVGAQILGPRDKLSLVHRDTVHAGDLAFGGAEQGSNRHTRRPGGFVPRNAPCFYPALSIACLMCRCSASYRYGFGRNGASAPSSLTCLPTPR
jgi:hypothetical protein